MYQYTKKGWSNQVPEPLKPYQTRSKELTVEGAAERFVQTFKQAMKASKQDGKSIAHRLENFLLTYCTTPHSTTNSTPAPSFLGRNIQTRFDFLKPDLEDTISKKQAE